MELVQLVRAEGVGVGGAENLEMLRRMLAETGEAAAAEG